MKLKVKTETVHVVEVNDLEQFIHETTGHTYEIVPNEEWGNDEQHRFNIDGKLEGYKKKIGKISNALAWNTHFVCTLF